MNKEYLLTPVIEVQDGDVLKSFQVRYMFILAFFLAYYQPWFYVLEIVFG